MCGCHSHSRVNIGCMVLIHTVDDIVCVIPTQARVGSSKMLQSSCIMLKVSFCELWERLKHLMEAIDMDFDT